MPKKSKVEPVEILITPAKLASLSRRREWVEHTWEGDTIEIVALSDIHIGDRCCNYKLLDKTIAHILAAENRFVIVNGDIINMATSRSPSSVYEQHLNNDEQFSLAYHTLEPIKHRILCLTVGNHENRAVKEVGLNVTQILCAMLDVPYCGPSAITLLRVGTKKGKSATGNTPGQIYTIFTHHTTGGDGYTKGSKINRVDLLNKIFPTADVYIGGHAHGRGHAEDKYKDFDRRSKRVIYRPRLYFASAGFVNYPDSYAEGMQLAPAPLGPTIITFSGSDAFSTWDRNRIGFYYIS